MTIQRLGQELHSFIKSRHGLHKAQRVLPSGGKSHDSLMNFCDFFLHSVTINNDQSSKHNFNFCLVGLFFCVGH